MNVVVILAGGVGRRLGADVPKQFVEVLGKPVLEYTLEAFELHPEIDAILVVCVKPYVDFVWEMGERYGLSKLRWVTEGGDTFQTSVLNGIRYLDSKMSDDDIVLVHFGASPFVTADIISDAIRVCKEKGNAVSTTDYYLLSGHKRKTSSVMDPENCSDEYIDRDTIAVMNAPHAFRFGFISNMYREAVESGLVNAVEPQTTTLMYAMGKRVYFSRGSQSNIKITRREDLELFEGYVLGRRRRENGCTAGDVVVFLADGFEECEALLVVDILRRAGLGVVMASVTGDRDVESSRGVTVVADCLAKDVVYEAARAIVLPGGRLGTEGLAESDLVRRQCLEFAEGKVVAAVCAAPTILADLGLLEGRRATVHPDFAGLMARAEVVDVPVVVDGNMVTGQGLGATIPFSLELVRILRGDEESQRIAKAICYKW